VGYRFVEPLSVRCLRLSVREPECNESAAI
jgi:hypothetical protein